MKSQKITLLIIVISLFFSFSTQAKTKKLLRLNLEKGAVYEMAMNMHNKMDQEMMGQQIKMDQKMEMITIMTVEDVLPSKNSLISYRYKSMKIDVDAMGNSISYDSNNSEDSNPSFKALKGITELTLKMEVTPLGEVINVEGFEGFSDAVSDNPQITQMLKMFTNEESFKSSFAQTFNYFPENKIAVGDTWESSIKMDQFMNMEIDMNFEVADIQKKNITLNVESDLTSETTMEQNGMSIDMKMNGQQNGTMDINSKDGMLRSSDIKQDISMQMKMKNPQTNEDMEMPMEMKSTINVTVTKK